MTKKHRQVTNTEVIFQLMNYSKHGAMMQGFVMQALEQYARSVASSEKPEDWPDMLSWDAWHGCAEEVVQELDKHFGRNVIDV
jgi:hypothetical protein